MFTEELNTALKAAREAGEIQLKCADSISGIERKEDCSPVTSIDRECEDRIRDILLDKFSRDGFLGEESGKKENGSGRRWIVDPLDGTRPYIRGIPTHSVLIALEENGTPVLGVIHLPALGLTCHAVKGGGAFLNDKRIRVSKTEHLDESMGSILGYVEYSQEPTGKALLELMRHWDYTYGFMDAYSYVLLASGSLDVCVNMLDKAWDCAAAACIVSEAGGRYSSITGESTIHGGSIVFSNKHLHEKVLSFFS
ncbi:MAG: inositol monophosphatase family protein [Chitinispirillaceae bacterium]